MDKKTGNNKSTDSKKQEPKPSEGLRSLDTWKRLSAARKALATEEGKQQATSDPAAYFEQFGLQEYAPSGDLQKLSELEEELLSIQALDEVEVTARRGVSAAVATPAGGVNAIEGGNVGGNLNTGANLNAGANLNVGKNANTGFPTPGPYYCFAAQTPVRMASGEDRRIADLTIGDRVLTMDLDTGLLVPCDVEMLHEHPEDQPFELTIGGVAMPLRVTAKHPIWVNGAWLPTDEVPVGAKLLLVHGGQTTEGRLLGSRPLGITQPVYDLTVSSTHTFFAGGVLVHNKMMTDKAKKK